MPINPFPQQAQPPPWQAPWYNPPQPAVGRGGPQPVGGSGLPRPLTGNPLSETNSVSPQLNYNVPMPQMQQFGAPWFGQPMLPHQVPINAWPNPWMENPGLPFQYQPPQMPMPWWTPQPWQPPLPADTGWKGAGTEPAMGQVTGEMSNNFMPQQGLPSGGGAGQQFAEPAQPMPPMPMPLYPGSQTFLAPWYGQGLFR